MDLVEFKQDLDKKIEKKSEHLTENQIRKCHQSYIDYHKASNPDEIYVIPMEEMAELTQHLAKIIRGKENTSDIGFLEELADVQICLDNLKIVANIDKDALQYAMDIKLERATRKIKAGTA